MAEGETQYNIPVSSKQLIVYFVFLVIALSAAFLAGVMVGRNVDSSPEPTVRDIADSIPEEVVASPTPDALTYGSTLSGDKIEGLTTAPGSTSNRAASSKGGSHLLEGLNKYRRPPTLPLTKITPSPETAGNRRRRIRGPSTISAARRSMLDITPSIN